jgi:hypothetical protein
MTAATNPRNGRGRLVATEEVAERDALILRLFAQGHSYQQVVDMRLLGIANRGGLQGPQAGVGRDPGPALAGKGRAGGEIVSLAQPVTPR